MNAEELCPQCKAPAQGGAFCKSCGARLTQAQDPFIGRTLLNQYIIQRRIGQGGYGSVYEALQPSINRKAAIKTLHPHLTHQPELVVRFHREGLATSQLTHPAVVKLYNFGETEDGILWFAMELVTGENLHERIKRLGPFSAKELVAALGPICEALQEAHDKKIIHRDIKPDNIMLPINFGIGTELTGEQNAASPSVSHGSGAHQSRPPQYQRALPKLLDFGVAGLIDEAQVTQSGMLIGSPQYMSPEQWRGLKYTDHRSDIYSLGVVAYQCLTGRLPFEADTAPSWMQKHCIEPLDLSQLSQIAPQAMQAVLQKALAKNADDRFQSAKELKLALEDSLRGIAPVLIIEAPSSAIKNNNTMPVVQAPKTWQGAVLGAAGATAIGAMLLFAFGFFSSPKEPSTQRALFAEAPSKPIEESAPGSGDAFENAPGSMRAASLATIAPTKTSPVGGKSAAIVKETTPTITPASVASSAPTSAPVVIAEKTPTSAPVKKRPTAPTRVELMAMTIDVKRNKKSEELHQILRETDFASCGDKKKMTPFQLTLFVAPSGKVTMVNSLYKDTVAACVKAVAKSIRFAPYDDELGSFSLMHSGAVF